MAVQRQRYQEIQEHPPRFIALLNRHPWTTRMFTVSVVVGEIAFGPTATALLSIALLATLYLWRWVSRPEQ
jgi:hypothetical protein